ncbi:MAG: hypothetical protein H6825_02115 [Planctomycetes bacterium]|nr:hypothetical protein [Planctomycetota bacterium]
MVLVAPVLLALTALLPPSGDDVVAAREALLAAAFPSGVPAELDPRGPGSSEKFRLVLESDLFLSAEVGPFDVYVCKRDGFAKERDAQKTLDAAVKGLEPVAKVMARVFDGPPGLVSGRRHPIVLASADAKKKEASFDGLVALLDWAEDDGSGWKQGGNPIWTPLLRADVTVRTWDTQLFNLAHESVAKQLNTFLSHGLGYYTVAHLVARLLNQGAWGMVPPWLAQGLTDELDIASFGEAWVGGEWFTVQTPGWVRPGWSGFVPQGMSPPPPVTGPPADLATTVTKGGDSWQRRDFSTERHWDNLVADRKTVAPASFRFMAEHESFLPRDRALARCLLHLLVEVAPPPGRPGLVELLDELPTTPPSGMPDADPLTVVVDKVLGGVPAVDDFEALPLSEVAERIGRPEIARRATELGASGMLALSDHREQALWLYRQPLDQIGWDARRELFDLILTAEYYQQLAEWKLLGDALDQACERAFEASKKYPAKEHDREKVAEAFWKGVTN